MTCYRFLIVTLCVLASACGTTPAAPPPAPIPTEQAPVPAAEDAAQPKVVFLGDSIAAGLHLPADQAFPAVLQRSLAARGVKFQLLNAGVSGDTTAGGLRRVDWLLKQKPAVVVLELGANDGMRGQPIAAMEQNLRAIIERIRAAGAQVLLLGIRIPMNYGPDYVRDFEAVYTRIADTLHVAFVPSFMHGVGGVPELNLEDGIHPTAQGHERLAATLVEPLTQLLAAKR